MAATEGLLEEPLQRGLTPRTALVIFYGAFILMPANIYLQLVAGQTLAGPISFIALILWVELSRLTDNPLSKAEAFIVYSVSAIAATQPLFYRYALFPAYFRRSAQAKQFLTELVDPETGMKVIKSFAELAPTWWVPSEEVISLRTFFHVAWILPIVIAILVWLFHFMADLSMAVIGRELFIKVEKLPFPFAHPTAEACKALTEHDPERIKTFTVAGVVGTVWGTLVYWPVVMGKKIVNYPIPWADLNRRVHALLPGASFGVGTDILAFTGGLIVPWRVVVSMLVGALGVQFVGNYLMVRFGYFERFVEGMNIATTRVNEIDVWASPLIGAMVAAGVLHIVSNPKALVRAFKGLAGTRKTAGRAETLPLFWLLVIFFGAVGGCVVLFRILVPDFPLWFIAPFAILWSFVLSLIQIRAVGTTGFRVDPPYVREGLIIGYDKVIGYKNPHVWFAPWPVSLWSSGWVQSFKVADLVRCRPRDFVKAAAMAYPVGMLANFVYMSIFWKIAPIPSSTYPFSGIWLPRQTRFLCGLMSTTLETGGEAAEAARKMFRLDWIVYTFLIFTAIHLVNEYVLSKFGDKAKGFRPSLIGLAVGMWMPIPFAVSIFIGGLVARGVAAKWARRLLLAFVPLGLFLRGEGAILAFIALFGFVASSLMSRKGEEWFKKNKNIVVAGLAVGAGVMVGIFAAISALKSSFSTLPY